MSLSFNAILNCWIFLHDFGWISRWIEIESSCSANPRPDALMKEQLTEMTGLSQRVKKLSELDWRGRGVTKMCLGDKGVVSK